jgi:hypothetical protein
MRGRQQSNFVSQCDQRPPESADGLHEDIAVAMA